MRRRACQAGGEGIVSKRADSPYVSGRGKAWLKCKCRQGQEFVIGGYTDPDGSRPGFGALLLGYYRPDGKLAYAGRVGTGFSDQTLRDLRRRMARLERRDSPFHDFLRGRGLRGVHWLKPELVAQVEFSNWTKDGLVRQAVFQGLRDDKPVRAVTREKPVVSSKATE
jgi:bifunctional non-homologous end joining protein LigD